MHNKASLIILVLVLLLAACTPGPSPTPLPAASPTPGDVAQATPGEPVSPLPTPMQGTATSPGPIPTQQATGSSTATAPPQPTAAGPAADPFTLISQDSLFATLEDLTAIQAYSGWRNSASQGEQEALDYVAGRLAELGYLDELGLEIERESFRVPIGNELRASELELTVGGQGVEVPAASLRGDREDLSLALNFDSDGQINDADPDPVSAEGPAVVVQSENELVALSAADVAGKIVFLDYAVIDRSLIEVRKAVTLAAELVSKGPAGVVLVTQNSNVLGESHGYGVGDMSAFTYVSADWYGGRRVPVLHVRLEDLGPAGIDDWAGLRQIEAARLTWDSDVSSPATSGNLIARIPGADPSRALILGAHIDSPNGPGAMDDGSGVAILLEIARVLDAARYQPAVDLYLAWFGSEELGLVGASHFVSTHQELLDRAVAMQEIDDLTRPLDGVEADLMLVTWSYSRLGKDELPWPEAVVEAAAARGVDAVATSSNVPWSDNTPFSGYDVPNADLIYAPIEAMQPNSHLSLHYAAHIHDPYDTVDMAREVADVFEDMARLALSAVLDVDLQAPKRVTPPAERRAVLVGSHTEVVHMTPASLTDFGMALAMEGFDVDLVPYGRPVTAQDLDGADMVIVLPVVDYPAAADDPGPYDEAWTAPELDVLEEYVADGGLLVLTNSAGRLKYYNRVYDPNEDAGDVNDLAARFGFAFTQDRLSGGQASVEGDSPLLDGVSVLEMAADNGLALDLPADAEVLAEAGRRPAVALVDYGPAGGQVLVLGDLGMLGTGGGPELTNLPFWRNLAAFARAR